MLALTQCWFTRRHYPDEVGHKNSEGVYRSVCRSCERPIISWDRSIWHLAEGFNLMQVYNSSEHAFLFLVDTRDDLVVARFPIDDLETEEEVEQFALKIRLENGVDEPGSMLLLRDSRGGRKKKRRKPVAKAPPGKFKPAPAPVYPTESPDDLTGLPGRGLFEAAFAAACEQAWDTQAPLSVAFVDIDGLDHINRLQGLDAGDRVIGQVAQLLRAGNDGPLHLSRNRGLEFIMLLPGADAVQATARVGQLQAEIARSGVASVSCGVAQVALDGDCRAALRAADEALHRAKSGKNG